VLEALRAHGLGESMREARLAAIADNNREHGFGALPASVAGNGTLHYADIVRVLDRTLTARDMLVLDAGNNRIWVTTSLRIRTPGQLVVPGGIGGMGWGLPAAAGTRMARPDRNVICLIGDGGATMTLGAIATCVQEQLPITVLVANNNGLGMVRDNMKQRRIAVDFSPIDFAAIACGMGCQGIRVNRADALGDAIAQARDSGVTTVIDVAIDPEASHVPVSDY
jgi:acetolactate synthase-1/2/3 large subunit